MDEALLPQIKRVDAVAEEAVLKIVRATPRPAKFKIATVVANDNSIWLCVYENEISQYDYNKREEILSFLEGLRSEISKGGLTVHLVGRPGDPPRAR